MRRVEASLLELTVDFSKTLHFTELRKKNAAELKMVLTGRIGRPWRFKTTGALGVIASGG